MTRERFTFVGRREGMLPEWDHYVWQSDEGAIVDCNVLWFWRTKAGPQTLPYWITESPTDERKSP